MEDGVSKNYQNETYTEKKDLKDRKVYKTHGVDSVNRANIHRIGVLKEEKKNGDEEIFEEIIELPTI